MLRIERSHFRFGLKLLSNWLNETILRRVLQRGRSIVSAGSSRMSGCPGHDSTSRQVRDSRRTSWDNVHSPDWEKPGARKSEKIIPSLRTWCDVIRAAMIIRVINLESRDNLPSNGGLGLSRALFRLKLHFQNDLVFF